MMGLAEHQAVLPNLRDIGNLPIRATSSAPPSASRTTRPGLLYRSAAPTAGAIEALQSLGVTHVFDLRSDVEVSRAGGPSAADACSHAPPAPVRVHVPVFQLVDYTPEAIALRYQAYAAVDTTAGFVSAYRGILSAGGRRAFAPILRHLAQDHPTPCLVHCTAGKDRTGLVCAIVLSLCGVDDDTIACEYALTDQGLAPLKKGIMQRLMSADGVTVDEAGASRMLSSRPESMLATLEAMRKEYGSVEEYVLNECGLAPDDIDRLRRNFVVVAEPPNGLDASRAAL
ncbi:Protein-tyrosine/Dual-specificity phosphatase [Metarhizium album ARSEF 1941]|uniref:Protein-tyrosine/Dual-specificity phosphatase n=1 Tax=Metarhizium album (strain ARSEF 1941) TaxID=1081103 RepID=A0A0B2WW72_METAS|nr:Protein-tyrosine/Dual-specificity phosphatase [Metarhizium album ARSEF 1941]KHO00442.1 Protein-tyrosine/Dual-specificity phosphatase [Metarhizium album ARSEF 1941]